MKGGAKWDGSQLVIEDEQEVKGKKTSFREVFSEQPAARYLRRV